MVRVVIPEFARGKLATEAVILLAVFTWLAATAWVRPLALPDEGRYVGVALEMLGSGDWLVPALDTLPYFHKPPLFYWLTGASLAIFGVNELGARLASLLAATGSAFAVYLFVRRYCDEKHARLALLVLSTTPFFFGGAQFANLDMLVAACIACTILCTADAVLAARGGRLSQRTLMAAYAFAALGVLAKGLIGVVIPVLVITTWLVVMGRTATILRLVWPPGLALFAATTIPWFALMEARYPGFLHYFFIHHHLDRYTTQQFIGHRPFWFYLPVFAGFTLPWFIFLANAVRKPAAGSSGSVAQQVHLLMWLWLVITLMFFSVPASKLVGYVLVAVPPFAVLAADGLNRFASGAGGRHRWVNGLALIAILICPVLVFVGRDFQHDSIQDIAARIRPMLAGDEIVAVRNYPFSLPFYLQRRQPIRVVDDWDDLRLLQKDTWRRELYEAAKFDPTRASTALLKPAALQHLLACFQQGVWVIAPHTEVARLPELARLQQVAVVGHHVLWRRAALNAASEHPDCGP